MSQPQPDLKICVQLPSQKKKKKEEDFILAVKDAGSMLGCEGLDDILLTKRHNIKTDTSSE